MSAPTVSTNISQAAESTTAGQQMASTSSAPLASPSISPAQPHPLASSQPGDMPELVTRPSVEGGISVPAEPKVHLRALVISGQSHMFSFEPELTVGRVKELIWSMWPSEWTSPAQPPSPAFLRILYAGRILQDDTTLSSNNMPSSVSPSTPTVIHISVRSFSIRAEDDPKKANLHTTTSRTRGAQENEVGGCKCLIM